MLVPDADHVAQESKGHQRIVGALVLEEEIEQHRRLAVTRGGEEEITLAASQRVFDERAGAEGESRPVDPGGELGREQPTKLALGVLGSGEDGFDERVVRRGRRHGREPI